jgi:hypothetical protein
VARARDGSRRIRSIGEVGEPGDALRLREVATGDAVLGEIAREPR